MNPIRSLILLSLAAASLLQAMAAEKLPRHPADAIANRGMTEGIDKPGKLRINGRQENLNARLTDAYRKLGQNDLPGAAESYRLALEDDPQNTDALLALGAIAWQQGRLAASREFRLRALVAAPGDPDVQAAILAGPQTAIAPRQNESRLRNLLAAQPESAALHFALGNLLARERRWAAARDAYLNAVNIDGDNPDYRFNLAVSHDHLRQTQLAIEHYHAALTCRGWRPAAFDPAHAQLRLSEIEP